MPSGTRNDCEEMTLEMTTRNASLEDLAKLLQDQNGRKLDAVVSSTAIRSENGLIVVKDAEPTLDESGVTPTDGLYRPTTVFDEGLAEKLGIPSVYLKKLRQERPDLFDANVNGWLHGAPDREVVLPNGQTMTAHPDGRKFLLRLFRGDGGEGVARAFLSDSYKMIDNLDVLTSALDGVREAGIEVEIDSCDLTERRMYVRLVSPQVSALAPVLLRNYRSPFEHGPGDAPRGYWNQQRAREFARLGDRFGWSGDMPILFAGLVIGNSETGGGAYSITPQIKVLTCWNGLNMTQDALRKVHLGEKLDDGIVKYSDDTQRKNLELVKAQTRDAVATFLNVEYIRAKIEQMEEKAGKPIEHPQATVETVGKTLRFSQETIAGVLDHFIRGGQVTAGGVMQAVTSYAQTVDDADEAFEMEAQALRALELASA